MFSHRERKRAVWQYGRVGITGENRGYIVEFRDKLKLETA